MPLSTIHMHWGDPIVPQQNEAQDSFRIRVGKALRAAELEYGKDTADSFRDDQITFV